MLSISLNAYLKTLLCQHLPAFLSCKSLWSNIRTFSISNTCHTHHCIEVLFPVIREHDTASMLPPLFLRSISRDMPTIRFPITDSCWLSGAGSGFFYTYWRDTQSPYWRTWGERLLWQECSVIWLEDCHLVWWWGRPGLVTCQPHEDKRQTWSHLLVILTKRCDLK